MRIFLCLSVLCVTAAEAADEFVAYPHLTVEQHPEFGIADSIGVGIEVVPASSSPTVYGCDLKAIAASLPPA